MTTPHRSSRLAAATVSLLLPLAALAAPAGAAAAPSSPSMSTLAALAAEPAQVTATDFSYAMYPLAKVNVGACTGPTTDITDAPYYSNIDCGLVGFTLSGDASTVQVKFFHGDTNTPFATEPATADAVSGGWTAQIEPPPTWPSGRIRVQVVADGVPAGESSFGHNLLGATFDDLGIVDAGTSLAVTGRVVELDNDSVEGLSDKGVPATFTLRTTVPGGEVVDTQQVTAGDDGSFTATVPAAATRDLAVGADTDYQSVLALSAVDAVYDELVTGTGPWRAAEAGTGSLTVVSAPDALTLQNSFVSSVGWVKPGDSFPSRLVVSNPTDHPFTDVTVSLPSPAGATFTRAKPSANAGSATITGGTVTWRLSSVPAATDAGATVRTLVLESQADTLAVDPQLVWKDLSSTATLTVGGVPQGDPVRSHGPRVIPPSAAYDTARFGDRPFPVVPVDYLDRKHQPEHSGHQLAEKINSPAVTGSTFNLYQEMSLGQLFPHGTVPSAQIATAGFDYAPGFDFTSLDPAGTCHGLTLPETAGSPAYPERISDGFYQLPGTTDYYGDDKTGSAVIGSLAGVGALADIDSACGPTGKLVYDAAAIADPEIDYSDYDTDKDGVVDFFMVVFAGCGGNGASQLSVVGCPSDPVPYDNVWPHSSSLEFYYTDPETGLAGFTTDDQLRDLEDRPLYYTDASRTEMTTTPTDWKVFVRVGPYNVNPETAIDKASVISHEYGHSLGLPDFYSTGSRSTYGDWNLMATDKSQNMDVFSRQELGWIVPEVLEPGSSTVQGWTDSKQDTHTIHWRQADGTPYTLQGPRVHNAQAYVAKLPGRQLIDPAKFDTGDKASATHAWWSGSGNDFGCAPTGGHNLDLAVPGLADLPAGSTVTLSLKSLFDIEWDYDYGYVLTSTDGGDTYTSHASLRDTPTTTSTNANQNACQAEYGNGITGSSGSYTDATTVLADRTLGNYPESTFIADSFDISDLAGAENGVLRFSYATDPGLARPGWFIDDVTVTATTPAGEQVLLDTDFESDGGPTDPRVFNGGCREHLAVATTCTKGWSYIDSSSEAPADHAYYLELRDRSGFDKDGHGENDRDPIGFEAGLSLVYTDEAHGYGNAGVDNPPAQSPLDATPEPGSDTPDLNDAAFTAAAGRSHFSDSGAGHTDNYSDPAATSTDSRYADVANPWRFQYDCLTFDVQSMSGNGVGPEVSDGDLTGSVVFDLGGGCGRFDYGYLGTSTTGGSTGGGPTGGTGSSGSTGDSTGDNTAPTARATAHPATVEAGRPVRLSAAGSTDAETPADLDYAWDFGDGGLAKDGADRTERATYSRPGSYTVRLTVTDPAGGTATDTVRVEVTGEATDRDATGTTDATDSTSAHRTRRAQAEGPAVIAHGSWRTRHSDQARGGRYLDNRGRGPGRDVLVLRFTGPRLVVEHARARQGGLARVLVDGERVGRVRFHGHWRRPHFGFAETFTGLGAGRHTVRLVMRKGAGYVDDFAVRGRLR